jgi:ATP-dependent Clp protease ATP-binding subunit ClpA
MFERFTERARRVVVHAQADARALGHDYIGTEHLLLGLLRVEDGVAATVLRSFDVTPERVQAEIERIIGRGEDQKAAGEIPFTPRAKKVLELALREALSLDHDYIGTEHILLGIVRENGGVAARILLESGVEAEDVRAKLVELLGGTGQMRRPRSRSRLRRAVFETLPPDQWEYRIERLDALAGMTQTWLSSLGAEGWELVDTVNQGEDGIHFIFKRPCRARRRATG